MAIQIAGAFARFGWPCSLCGKDILPGDGIATEVIPGALKFDQPKQSNSKWSHYKCLDTIRGKQSDIHAAHNVAGYVKRKGKACKPRSRKITNQQRKYTTPKSTRTNVGLNSERDLATVGDLHTADTILGFDILTSVLPQWCKREGVNFREYALKTRDLKVEVRLLDPPRSDERSREDGYSLIRLSRSHPKKREWAIPGDTSILLSGREQGPVDELTSVLAAADHYPQTSYGDRERQISIIAMEAAIRGIRIDVDELGRQLSGPQSCGTLKSIQHNQTGGRVHPHVDASTATGRLSVSCPNPTSLGKRGSLLEQRKVLIPDEGECFLSVDLRQIEVRTVAALSQDPDMLALFVEGRDIYTEVAEDLLGDPRKRDAAKEIVLGLSYGMGNQKIAEAANIDQATARNFVRGMAEKYPLWTSWLEEVIYRSRRQGSLRTLHGRRVHVPASSATTAGPARLVQSTARDIFMDGVLRMDELGLTEHLRLMLHDEVLMSVPIQEYEQFAARTIECLSTTWTPPGLKFAVPIEASAGLPGSTWADCYRGEK